MAQFELLLRLTQVDNLLIHQFHCKLNQESQNRIGTFLPVFITETFLSSQQKTVSLSQSVQIWHVCYPDFLESVHYVRILKNFVTNKWLVLVQHKLIIMSLDSLYHATNKRLSEAQDILSTIASNRIHVDNETLSQKHREISARVDHILR